MLMHSIVHLTIMEREVGIAGSKTDDHFTIIKPETSGLGQERPIVATDANVRISQERTFIAQCQYG
jgi:hypothetical protein